MQRETTAKVSQPVFAFEVALAGLYWMARGAGYELIGADVGAARDHAIAAAEAIGACPIADNIAGVGPAAVWVRKCLGIEA